MTEQQQTQQSSGQQTQQSSGQQTQQKPQQSTNDHNRPTFRGTQIKGNVHGRRK